MYSLFYIPFLYMRYTRLLKKGRLLSFFIILILPPIYITTFVQSDFTLANFLKSIIGLIIIQNLYEVGYIQNDAETIKKEINPTLRLNAKQLDYYNNKYFSIYLYRFILSIVLSLILIFFCGLKRETFCFLTIAHLLIPIYLIYNNIRNMWNLFLHFILTTIKFTAIQFLFLEKFDWKIFVCSLFAFPAINLIERSANDRFFPLLAKRYEIAFGRFVYYFIQLFIQIILFINMIVSWKLVLIFLYYFIYRTLILIREKKYYIFCKFNFFEK